MLVPSVQRTVATPSLVVVADGLLKLPPPDETRKSTVTSGTPRPCASVTLTAIGAPSCAPIAPDCLFPAEIASVVGLPIGSVPLPQDASEAVAARETIERMRRMILNGGRSRGHKLVHKLVLVQRTPQWRKPW